MSKIKVAQHVKDVKSLIAIRDRYSLKVNDVVKEHEELFNLEYPDLLEKVKKCVKNGDEKGLKKIMKEMSNKKEDKNK